MISRATGGITVKNLLVLDTSTHRATIGVLTREGKSHVLTAQSDRQHGRDLIPCIKALLNTAAMSPRDIDVIGVGLGPGSYTGLRVGATAAKTLAYATGATLIGLDTLEAIARNAPAEASRVTVIGDAQRGDLYVSEWVRDVPSGPLRGGHPCHVEPTVAWLGRLEPSVIVLGPALASEAIRFLIPPKHLRAGPSSNFPDARRLLELALHAATEGARDDLWKLEPRYLRRSSAEEKWESLRTGR
jgi:tRNA threonylcarbamoyladenosine biosynthesis protein TsaB